MTLPRDVRCSFRTLRKNPVFSVMVIIILAIGIGANTAVFSTVDADILHPIPYNQPNRIIQIFSVSERMSARRTGANLIALSDPEFSALRSRSDVFQQLAAYDQRTADFTNRGEPEELHGAAVSASLFALLQVKPLLGTVFSAREETAGLGQVVLLSYAFWQRRFFSDRKVIGQSIVLDGKPYRILGVLPKGFEFPEYSTEFWIPFVADPNAEHDHILHGLRDIARLRDGVSLSQAQSALSIVAATLAESFPSTDKGWMLRAVPFRRPAATDTRLSLLILWAAVSLVLLIACTDIAILLLARGTARQREISVRMILGATRTRIAYELLMETLLLSVMGGLAGLFVAHWSVRVISLLLPLETRSLNVPHLSISVLLFTFALSILSVLMFGPAVVLLTNGSDLSQSLKENATEIASDSRAWYHIRKALVTIQVALALVLLTSAGLMLRSFSNLVRSDPGFNTNNLLVFELRLPTSDPGSIERGVFVRELIDRIGATPGVAGAAITSTMFFDQPSDVLVNIPYSSTQNAVTSEFRFVSPGMFGELEIPFVRGRDFSATDDLESSCAVIINQSLARSGWPNEDPIGRTVKVGLRMPTPMCTVVGVVTDTRDVEISKTAVPEMYLPYLQQPGSDFYVVVRAIRNPQTIADAVRQQIWKLDEHLPVQSMMTMEDAMELSVSTARYRTVLLSCFGGISLLLALLGLYGVVSYFVSRRTHEIGIRIALGANPNEILRMIVGRGLKFVSAGIILGLIGALFATQALSSFLFGIKATDPLTYSGIFVLFIVTTLAACYIPAHRAMRTEPIVALRGE